MNLKKHIPNTLTLLNLAAGLLALNQVVNGFYDNAFIFVCLGIFFDFFDGFLARKWGVAGELGVQLDSLADMVTCGVVPSYMIFKIFENIQTLDYMSPYYLTEETWYMGFVPYLGFSIALASCYRLANFNIDKRQTESFIGLPTPANALLIMSLPMIKYQYEYEWPEQLIDNPFVILLITAISTYILNANIPLFSFKIKEFSFQKYKLQIIFLLSSLVLLFWFNFLAFPIIIISYVLVSLITNKIKV